MTYEFQVRFKGYGPEDDMWLLASSFNKAVSFQMTSRFGQKRLHKTSKASSAHMSEPPAKMSKSPQEKKCNKQDVKSNKDYRDKSQGRDAPQVKKRNGQDAKDNRAEKQALNAACEAKHNQPKNKGKRSKPKRSVRLCSLRKEKGKSFQSSLTKKECRLPKRNLNVIILGSEDSDVKNTDNDYQSDIQRSVLRDLRRREDNFATPCRYLAEVQLPLVDQNIQVFTIKHVSSELDDHPCDPLTVDRVVVTESMKELVKTKNKEGNEEFNFIVQYASYGSFTQEGVRILSRLDTLRRVKREVQEEARWLDGACRHLLAKEETVKEALLDRWNLNGQLLVQYKGFNVMSQELSVLCCERYLTDEIINVLTIKYCDAANARLERDVFAMLPTDISKQFRESAVFNLSANIDMSTVEMIFLPMLLHGNHWGLLVFNVRFIEYETFLQDPTT